MFLLTLLVLLFLINKIKILKKLLQEPLYGDGDENNLKFNIKQIEQAYRKKEDKIRFPGRSGIVYKIKIDDDEYYALKF